MASSTAELTLLLKAKIAAQGAVDTLSLSLDKVKGKASAVRDELGKLGSGLSAGLGNLTENLLTGQDLGQAATNLGAFLAGETVQEFGTSIVQKMAGSAAVQAVGGAMAAFGSTIGGLIAAAIPVGMALWPVLLVGAIVAGIVFLINNPELVSSILAVAGNIVHTLVSGLAGLPGMLLGVFTTAGGMLITATTTLITSLVGFWLGLPGKLIGLGADIVRTIVNGLVSLPGKIADVVRQAFANLKIDVGPFHIRATGVTIDIPNLGQDPRLAGLTYAQAHGLAPLPGHAGGGWAGLHGPEISWLGEDGPEYVRKAGTGTGDEGGAGVRILGVTADELADMIDRELYFRLTRASATLGR